MRDAGAFSTARSARSWATITALAAVLVFAGYRIVAITMADRYAPSDPARALAWIPQHPAALLISAEADLAAARYAHAEATARKLLVADPAQGAAFRVIAQAAAHTGRIRRAVKFHLLSVRRSPREVPSQAWLIEHFITTGQYTAALARVEELLRLSPRHVDAMVPILARLSADPEFSEALAVQLERRPRWWPLLVSRLASEAASPSSGVLLSTLRSRGELSLAEHAEWLEGLMAQGRWEEAYARWVGSLPSPSGGVPLVFDGEFRQPASGSGFGWRLPRAAGAAARFLDVAGSAGRVAQITIKYRRPGDRYLEQPLLLAPGQYRFTARMRAASLAGVETDAPVWTIHCDGDDQVLATGARVTDGRMWRRLEMDVAVPADCPHQWLHLSTETSALPGASQMEVDVADVAMAKQAPVGNKGGPIDWRLQTHVGVVMRSRGDGFRPVADGEDLGRDDRLLVAPGAKARLTDGANCRYTQSSPGVYVMVPSCGLGQLAGARPLLPKASRLAADMAIQETILNVVDRRGPVAMGR